MFHRFQEQVMPHLLSLQKMRLLDNPTRALEAANLRFDYSQQFLTDALLTEMAEFLEAQGFSAKIEAMFQGQKINVTENRAVLHTALRSEETMPLVVEGQNVREEIAAEFKKMEHFVEQVYQEGRYTDVVNLGIGGSDLGPRMVVRALRYDWQNKVRVHFVSNVDGTDIFETLADLNPDTTLFILASKSFTTQETLMNAETAKAWLGQRKVAAHFVAITSRPDKAEAWGVEKSKIFAMWDFVGGRYSLWSVIGLPIALAVGMKNFKRLLKGACAMDQHFRYASWRENIPVLLALIATINQNFLGAKSHAVLPYDQTLEFFPAYLQQVDMESNGKRVTLQNQDIDYQTGVTLWGGVGTNGQHAFHQLLHQGNVNIPIDFILPLKPRHPYAEHHHVLMANCYAQKEALLLGRKTDEPYRNMPGNRPASIITMPELNPETLGALIALYEHKIFVQSLLWDINAFDQFGVELGKELAQKFLSAS